MTLTNQANYAFRAMMFLTRENTGEWISSAVVAEAMDIPRMFLSRINMQLVDAGLIKSRRGAGGGIKLAKNPESISLYEVLDAIDGPLILDKCLGSPEEPTFPMADQYRSFFQDAQKILVDKFSQTSLKDLVEDHHSEDSG
ncbi:MAG: Rrf2 family transcriptional regulator [Chloroflexi bacterium]|nr:Rrf2 family transcriptional regulator [Chloroflexota bacterium]